MKIENAKKRMMFNQEQDFNLVAYNILLILDILKCRDSRSFKNYRKLGHIIPFVSDSDFFEKIKHKKNFDFENKLELMEIHNKAVILEVVIKYVLQALEKEEYIEIFKDSRSLYLNVKLIKKPKIIDSKIFDEERDAIQEYFSHISRFNIKSYETIVEEIYGEGVI